MKAAVYYKYGPPDVVQIQEVPTPEPKENEVLIRIYATTVSTADWRGRSLDLPKGFGPVGRLVFGIFGPRKKILGTELSGVVESVGKSVTRYQPGDKVFADCGLGFGGHAEFIAIPEDGPIAIKPEALSFVEASALCFGGNVALDFLKKMGNLQAGESVLVNGASGTTGSALVQFAKYYGAEVTGVCSTANVQLVQSLGADYVIDYTVEDFTQNGKTYDIIADTAGTASWARCNGSLRENGRLLIILGGLSDMILSPLRSKKDGKKALNGVAGSSAESCRIIAEIAQAGAYKPVIDGVYPFADIVAAHARVDSGKKRGSVVVQIQSDTPS